MNDAKKFNGVDLKKGSSYIIVDFPIGYGSKNKLIRTLPKYPNNTENVRDFINNNERLVAFFTYRNFRTIIFKPQQKS